MRVSVDLASLQRQSLSHPPPSPSARTIHVELGVPTPSCPLALRVSRSRGAGPPWHPPELVVCVVHLPRPQLGHEQVNNADEDEEVDLCEKGTSQGHPEPQGTALCPWKAPPDPPAGESGSQIGPEPQSPGAGGHPAREEQPGSVPRVLASVLVSCLGAGSLLALPGRMLLSPGAASGRQGRRALACGPCSSFPHQDGQEDGEPQDPPEAHVVIAGPAPARPGHSQTGAQPPAPQPSAPLSRSCQYLIQASGKEGRRSRMTTLPRHPRPLPASGQSSTPQPPGPFPGPSGRSYSLDVLEQTPDHCPGDDEQHGGTCGGQQLWSQGLASLPRPLPVPAHSPQPMPR